MSNPAPFGGGSNPFEGLPLFADLAKLFMGGGGPVNWEIAKQVSVWMATGGQPEGNVDPLVRISLEELVRVAEMHVAQTTGLETTVAGGILRPRAMGKAEWAMATLDAWRPLLERLAESLSAMSAGEPEPDDPDAARDPFTAMFANLPQVMGPVLLGFQAGTMIGHLANKAMGGAVLPIPRPRVDELLLVPATIDGFASDWSLPVDDVRLWVCLDEVVHHAVLGLPHVSGRLDALLAEYASGFRPDAASLEAHFEGLDPTRPDGIQGVLADPEALLGALQSDEQREVANRLQALVTAIEGYCDHVLDRLGRTLIGSSGQLAEALRRRRVEEDGADRFVEHLLGLDLSTELYARGDRFVKGILERAGDEGLARLWESEATLPTPAEVDAPGLWLARIEYL